MDSYPDKPLNSTAYSSGEKRLNQIAKGMFGSVEQRQMAVGEPIKKEVMSDLSEKYNANKRNYEL